MRTAVTRRRWRRHHRCCSTPSYPGPSIRAYKGSGNPGGVRSYHGLDVPSRATSSRRPGTGRFFGGSGSGPSREAYPFSLVENFLMGAIVVGGGARRKKQASEEEMGDRGSAPLPIYSKGRPIGVSHDRR